MQKSLKKEIIVGIIAAVIALLYFTDVVSGTLGIVLLNIRQANIA